MLFKCCLSHIDMIFPRHAIFCIYVSMSRPRSISYMDHIISLKQPHLFIWTFLPKIQPQGIA